MDRLLRLSGACVIALALLPFVAGCSDDEGPVVVDTPPYPPVGVFSVTGDGVVSIYWIDNWEDDLAGYRIYRSANDLGPYDTQLGEVGPNTTYFDVIANNGETWYYAVTAFDRANNESGLSLETVFDTPRPEGFDLVLVELGQNSFESGYDFSSLTGMNQDRFLSSTDIYFERIDGINWIQTTAGVDIQDWGVIDLVAVDWAPDGGYLPSGKAEAVVGHSYVVQIAGQGGIPNWAKIYVKSVTSTTLTLDWAYQGVAGNPELLTTGGTVQ